MREQNPKKKKKIPIQNSKSDRQNLKFIKIH